MSARDKMKKVIRLLEQESPVILVREAWWRAEKRWRRMRFRDQIKQAKFEVQFRPIGYDRLQETQIPERSRTAILGYADCICSGKFPFFGYGPVSLGLPPRWNYDFVSGKDWPHVPADSIRVVRNDGSDVKVPWDLSRLQFLPVLAKAWQLTGEADYKESGKVLLSDWIEKNPVGVGVNWTIAMEAALRAISICFFLELLWPAVQNEHEWVRKVTHSLWQHLLYIEAHNEFSHLGRSNHYLSNIVGLFCLASFLHGPQNLDRRNLYSNLVQREIEEQVYADGGSFEASSGYHFLATQMFSTTYELMLAQNLHPGAGFTERLYKMYAFLAALADRQGFLPQIGDCDDGRVELLPDDISQMSSTQPECRHSLQVQSFLGMGQALFARDLGGTSEHAGCRTAAKLSAADRESDPRCCVFPHSGIVVLQNEHAKLVFLAQPNGIRGRGSHTHNDKLSVLLSIEGKELLVDSGTGGYTRDAATRNYFRSTAAHNTILIDDQEQNRFSVDPASLFRMQNDAAVSAVECRNSDGFILESGHSGFRRLAVDHVRAVHLRSGTLITIEDKFAGGGEHTFEAFFHLPRGWEVILSEQNGRKVRCILNGACRAEMLWGAEAELRLNRRVGRISRAYGATQEATTLSVTGKAKFPFLLTTEISWNA